MEKLYYFYTDPGHGWLAVPHEDIAELGINERITAYSYRSGEVAFLEEDQDASTFLEAAKAYGWDVTIRDAAPVKDTGGFIRDLPRY